MNRPPRQVASFALLLWSGEPGVSAERICLPFPRPGARDRGRINAAPVASVYLDLFCKVWFWGEAGKGRPFPNWCVEMFNEHQTVIGTHMALLNFDLASLERCQMCEFKFANGASKKEHMRVAHRIQIG